MCVTAPGQTKYDTDLKFGLQYIIPLTLSKNGFFVFSIKSPWRPLASKNCRVTWIFRISPRLPCYIYIWQFLKNCLQQEPAFISFFFSTFLFPNGLLLEKSEDSNMNSLLMYTSFGVNSINGAKDNWSSKNPQTKKVQTKKWYTRYPLRTWWHVPFYSTRQK